MLARQSRSISIVLLFLIVVATGLSVGSGTEEPPASAPASAPSDADRQAVVERGAYLARAANCVSCHTAAGGQPFAGGRAFQTTYSFLGSLYSSNISSDRATGIGAWAEQDFIQAMRFGLAPGQRHLFPAFPYTAFTRLSTPDLEALFAYLQTLPAVRSTPPSNSFWFRQRWAMTLWNWLFFKPGELKTAPDQSPEWNRGAYLVEALGHCGACHRPRNLLMAERPSAPLSGGVLVDEVEPGKLRRWSAPDLTNSKRGAGTWSADDLHKYLKTGHSRRAGVFGPMNEVFANSLRYLSDEDLSAMVTYLKGAAPAAGDEAYVLTTEERSTGQALYDKHCEECHLSTGRGAVRKGPAVTGSAVVQARHPSSLINIILYGASPSPDVAPTYDAYDDMPAFDAKLTNHEVAILATFLRNSWDNRGAAVSDNAAARQR